MSRGRGWWGTAPVVVGAAGLLLMVFGAKALQDADEINAAARQKAQAVEKLLNDAQGQKGLTPQDRAEEIAVILMTAQEQLQNEGKAVNLRSVAAQASSDVDSGADWVGRVRDACYDARSDHREAKDVLTGRIAFYGGLILVFAAGVLLYRRTPETAHKEW